MANKIQFGIDFKLDKQGLTQAKSEIEKIKKSLQEGTKLKIGGDSIEKLKREIEAFDTALDRAFDKDLNKLNVNKLNSELKKANISMSDFKLTDIISQIIISAIQVGTTKQLIHIIFEILISIFQQKNITKILSFGFTIDFQSLIQAPLKLN